MNNETFNLDFCCACLKVCSESDQIININSTTFQDISYKIKLKFCVPEMVLEHSHDYGLCNPCLSALDTAYTFRCMCLRTESKLEEFRLRKQDCMVAKDNIKQELFESSNKRDILNCSSVSKQVNDETLIEVVKNELGYLLTESLESCTNDTADIFEETKSTSPVDSKILDSGNIETLQLQIDPGENNLKKNPILETECKLSDLDIMKIACKTIPELYNCTIDSLQCQVAIERINVISPPIVVPKPFNSLGKYNSKWSSKGRLYWCNQCNKYICRKDRFNAHILRHSNIKAYKCKSCSLRFFSNDALYNHSKRCKGQQITVIPDSVDDISLTNHFLNTFEVIHNEILPQEALGATSLQEEEDLKVSEDNVDNCEYLEVNVLASETPSKKESLSSTETTVTKNENTKGNVKTKKKRNPNGTFKVFGCRSTKKKLSPKRKKTCELCGHMISGAYKLRIHMYRHINERPFKCTQCPQSFVEKWILNQHINKKHSEIQNSSINPSHFLQLSNNTSMDNFVTSIKNESCESNSSTSERVVTPIIQSIHSLADETNEPKTFSCKLCCKVNFESENLLHMHMKMHKDEFMCVACNKIFASKDQLQTHKSENNQTKHDNLEFSELQTPTGFKSKKKKFYCTVCNLEFSHRDHKNTHTGARPYKCKECGKHFGAYSTLRRHKLIHTKPPKPLKPRQENYLCEVCQKIFKSLEEVYSHRCQNALGESVYRCQICKHAFIGRGALVEHMGLHITENDAK